MTTYKTIRNVEAKRLRASGLLFREIAAAMSITVGAAGSLCHYQPTGAKKGRSCNGNGERARALREQGMTFSAIGEALAISRQGAHALCHYRASDEFRGRGGYG